MKCKCGNLSCECDDLAFVPDDVWQKETERRKLLREEQEDDAEMRRDAFFKEQWPRQHLWAVMQFLPLLLLVLLDNLAPQTSQIYHNWFAYTAVVFTCVLILLVYIKWSRVTSEFEQRYPEDADLLSFPDKEE